MASGPAAAIFLLALFAAPFSAAGQQTWYEFGVGARYHSQHSEFETLPFGDGDFSYLATLEYSEPVALWQLAMGFAPDVTGSRGPVPDEGTTEAARTQYVITPQLNLIFKDRMFRGGAGILRSYIRDRDSKGEWTNIYWQTLLGLSFDIGGSASLNTGAHYVFRGWDKIREFSFNDLDYSLLLSFRF